MVWERRREVGLGWGTRVYLWQIHVDIWQNKYNIVKLKNKKKKRNRRAYSFLSELNIVKRMYNLQ